MARYEEHLLPEGVAVCSHEPHLFLKFLYLFLQFPYLIFEFTDFLFAHSVIMGEQPATGREFQDTP